MAKNKHKRKRGNDTPSSTVSSQLFNASTATTSPEDIPGDLTSDDLEATNATLRALLINPTLITTPALKPIRLNLYALLKSLSLSSSAKTYTAPQLSSIVSDALDTGAWGEALVALQAMDTLKRTPKLGSVQRWVSRIVWDDEEAARALLGAVIKVSGQKLAEAGPRAATWNEWTSSTVADEMLPSSAQELSDEPVFETLVNEDDINFKHVRIVRDVSGTPLFAQSAPPITPSHLGFADGALALSNVLHPAECARLLDITEGIGYEDASGYALSAETSSLDRGASGVVWCMTPENTEAVFSRIKSFLPAVLPANGGAVCGINARFRFYKYKPGAVYKPHIDGAWPGSGYDQKGKYALDAFGDRHSRLTLIMYLNDGSEFEGGETRFYAVGNDGDIVTRSVKPRVGGCLLFPHGDAHVGIVHEGSPVLKGVKHIIRTDVLYLNK